MSVVFVTLEGIGAQPSTADAQPKSEPKDMEEVSVVILRWGVKLLLDKFSVDDERNSLQKSVKDFMSSCQTPRGLIWGYCISNTHKYVQQTQLQQFPSPEVGTTLRLILVFGIASKWRRKINTPLKKKMNLGLFKPLMQLLYNRLLYATLHFSNK